MQVFLLISSHTFTGVLTVTFDESQDRKFRTKTGQHIGQLINPTVSLMGKTSLSHWDEVCGQDVATIFRIPIFSCNPLIPSATLILQHDPPKM